MGVGMRLSRRRERRNRRCACLRRVGALLRNERRGGSLRREVRWSCPRNSSGILRAVTQWHGGTLVWTAPESLNKFILSRDCTVHLLSKMPDGGVVAHSDDAAFRSNERATINHHVCGASRTCQLHIHLTILLPPVRIPAAPIHTRSFILLLTKPHHHCISEYNGYYLISCVGFSIRTKLAVLST
jgi:hypothetical protein